MPDLLLELFSEEIPARMQAQAAKDLERLVVGALSDRGLLFEGVKAFAGPRRLTLAVSGLAGQAARRAARKRKARASTRREKAIDGFLRSAGVTLEQCQKRDDGKGEFYVAVIDAQGPRDGRGAGGNPARGVRQTALAEIDALAAGRAPVRWVRPLHSILCTFDGEVCRSASPA